MGILGLVRLPALLPPVTNLLCTVSLSLFAGPEQILRRFSVFAEEPRKSIITTTEPCSPVFKEAQPRPSKQSVIQFSLVQFSWSSLVVLMFLQETVIYCNKASNRIVSIPKGFSVFFWITLSHEVSRHFPTRTSTYANFENLLYIHCIPTDNKPLHWWRIRCPVEGGRK